MPSQMCLLHFHRIHHLVCRIKEERMKKNSEGAFEVLAWVNKSRRLEEKLNAEKEKALHLSKVFEEQVWLSFMLNFLYNFFFLGNFYSL